MPEDHTNLKDNAKEQVLAAIQALRAKGAEINPYTVANEGGVPRSTIYRNAELMELISREKAEPAEKLVAKDAGFPDRIAELESQVEELGQTIWNLEKQNEDLQKDFSDAWTMGFAAGLEEANKRHAKGIKSDAPTAATESSAWPSVERNATATGDGESANAEGGAIITPAPPQSDFSGKPAENDAPSHTAPVISPVTAPASATREVQTAATVSSENSGAVAGTASNGSANADSAAGSATAASSGNQGRRAIDQAESGTFNAAAAPIKNNQSLNSIIDFSTAAENAAPETSEKRKGGKDAEKIILADRAGDENEFAYYGDEVVLGQEYLYSEELLKEAESILFGGSDKPAATNGGKKEAAAEANLSPTDKSAGEVGTSNYTLDFSQAPSQPSPSVPGAAGLESGVNIGAIAAATAVPTVGAKQVTPAASVFAAQYASSGIYNVARSGPYVASDFNPLIELSWKDIEDVYNYRASTLKDYARNVPSAPNKHGAAVLNDNGTNGADKKPAEFGEGDGLVDASILAMLPSDAELQNLHELETAVYMSEEVADIVPEGTPANSQDPDATGDRMQAMVGYKPEVYANRLNISPEEAASQQISSQRAPKQPPPAFDAEGIVDLDALDIFDNLDEWIDLDRLERGEDPFGKAPDKAPAPAAKDIKTDELAELIKKRIEQASEIAPEAGAARGLGFGKPPTHAGPGPGPQAPEAAEAGGEAAQPRARNKFIGGKASSGEAGASTPSGAPAPFVIKTIPPEIRKACLILGVRQEDLTTAMVVEAWKKQIVDVHPDKGGDTETAIILNTAKDSLVHWIDSQAPKLGKKFGGGMSTQKDKDKDKG